MLRMKHVHSRACKDTDAIQFLASGVLALQLFSAVAHPGKENPPPSPPKSMLLISQLIPAALKKAAGSAAAEEQRL